MSEVGVVAIGRNEGERLKLCLRSAIASERPVVYVDSGSTDGSVAFARGLGVNVVDLDTSMSFSAARARNAGRDALKRIDAALRFVMFVDGDCEIHANWLSTAVDALKSNDRLAAVAGRRRERHPEASIYNRLTDLEWDTPIGPARSLGGDAVYRTSAFDAVGGFNPGVKAGEEPELCKRLRDAGWQIERLEAEMTLHDAAMTRWGQWWRRQVRSGYGGSDVATRFGLEEFIAHNRSARLWTLGPIALLVLGACVGAWMRGAIGAAVALVVVIALLGVQVLRMARYAMDRGLSVRQALGYGVLMLVSKWGQLLGQIEYRRDRKARREVQLIEYK